MARSVKQRAAQRKASLASARKRRKRGKYQRKIAKNNRRIANLNRGLKELAADPRTNGSPLHRQVAGRKVKRQRQNARYASKVKGWS